ncbi:MAG: LVIVD repeat protein [Candidatus Uhrbacteria bacterium GW2011_GWA2_52_8d]|uniref:LVIVD repeat protein n=1 Tax=Candidatus Uhrbacteria bacterium GW2011_GWA2_52_8d TaxID=1618979 RepID=A0A0G1XNJ3_9BACT|nr:MAG: LVIVD repeat protein [Candidatus Uhrbacteria bacterium GW2011_GWA2_52_8d]
MECYKSQRGVQSLEVIISITLFAIIIVSIFVLFGSSITESGGLLKQARANTLVLEGLEGVRFLSANDWSALEVGQHGLVYGEGSWTFSGDTDVTDDVFFRTVSIEEIDSDTKDVVIEVYWNYWGRLISRTAVTRLTNWQNVEVWGNWGVPIIVGSLNIGPQGQATGVVRSGDYAFLTATTSSGSRPSLFSINIQDPTIPTIADSYITNNSLLSLVLVADTYLYAVGEGEELMVFDVSDPTDIQWLSSYALGDEGLRVIVDGTYVFVGTESDVLVYDVSTPSTPTLVSQYTVTSEVNDLVVYNEYLYAATSFNTQEVLILSLEDIESVTVVGSYDLSGSVDATALRVDGSKLYVGRANNSSTSPEFYQFDPSDPLVLVEKNAIDTSGGIYQITTAGPYVYLATEVSNLEFQIWQAGSNWSMAYTAGINMAQVATGIAFDDNTIFISLRSNDAFQVIQPSP